MHHPSAKTRRDALLLALGLAALLMFAGPATVGGLGPVHAQSAIERDQAPGSGLASPDASPAVDASPVAECQAPVVSNDRIDGCIATYAVRFDPALWTPNEPTSDEGFEQTALAADPHTRAFVAAIEGLAPESCSAVRIAELQASDGVLDVFVATELSLPASDGAISSTLGYTVAQPDGAVFSWRELVDCRSVGPGTTLRLVVITPAWAWDLMLPSFNALLSGIALDPNALPTPSPTATPTPFSAATATASATSTPVIKAAATATPTSAPSASETPASLFPTTRPTRIPAGSRVAIPAGWTTVRDLEQDGARWIEVTNGRSTGWFMISADYALDANQCQQTHVNDWGMVPKTWDLSTLPSSSDAWYRYQRSDTLTVGGYYLYRDGREYALFVGCLADEAGSVGLIVETPWGDSEGWREDVSALLDAILIEP